MLLTVILHRCSPACFAYAALFFFDFFCNKITCGNTPFLLQQKKLLTIVNLQKKYQQRIEKCQYSTV